MLLEILIALTIFTTSFLFILGAFPICARAVHQSRCVFLANQIAQQRQDMVAAQPFATIPSYVTGLPGTASIVSINNGTTEVISFSIATTCSQVGDPNLLDIRTQVSWTEGSVMSNQAFTRYVNVETYLANAP